MSARKVHDTDQSLAAVTEFAGHVMAFYKAVLDEMRVVYGAGPTVGPGAAVQADVIARDEAMKLTQSWVAATTMAGQSRRSERGEENR